jgi:putative nucleotidyltransferase with HDIG domain
MARVEDANHHLAQMNEMYLSTIEALAMAVDAKDQVTHGHVRRVQNYALALAKALNVNDDGLIRAVEAASLLHDMGKLAVPEHILNKPGKLTKAEFERMKLHADIGADILSSIRFPYPVIPIVRHHHENWDGTGYPHGLRGTDIPIGARILAVVDCFDALTSDRPYRKKLSDQEATDILLERRGKMYDPLVVDTFLTIYSRVAESQQQIPTEAQTALMELTKLIASNKSSKPARDFFEFDTGLLREAFRICHALDALAFDTSSADRYTEAVRHLQTIGWADCLILFGYARERDCLVPIFSSSQDVMKSELEIPLGDKLTGWVAANRASVLNASPSLDASYADHARLAAFKSVMSVPLTLGDQLVGVVSLYSEKREAYSIEQLRLLEVIAPHLALLISNQSWDGAMGHAVPTEVRVFKPSAVH